MADFCSQCSMDLFGEGCGPIQVDLSGCCISTDCLKAGHQ